MEELSLQERLDWFLLNKRNIELYRKTKLFLNNHLKYRSLEENHKDEIILKIIKDLIFGILIDIFIFNRAGSRPSKSVKWIKSQWMNFDEIILDFVKELVLDCLADDGRFPHEDFDLTYIKEEISTMTCSNLKDATRINGSFLEYLGETLTLDTYADALFYVYGYTMNSEEILEERKKAYEEAIFKYSKLSKNFIIETAPENLDIGAVDKKIKIKFNGMDLERAKQHFIPLSLAKNKLKQPFLSSENLEIFIQKCLVEDKKLETKLKLNFNHGEKGFMINVFHKFYTDSQGEYENSNSVDKYIQLLTDNFEQFVFEKIKPNFHKHKEKVLKV